MTGSAVLLYFSPEHAQSVASRSCRPHRSALQNGGGELKIDPATGFTVRGMPEALGCLLLSLSVVFCLPLADCHMRNTVLTVIVSANVVVERSLAGSAVGYPAPSAVLAILCCTNHTSTIKRALSHPYRKTESYADTILAIWRGGRRGGRRAGGGWTIFEAHTATA